MDSIYLDHNAATPIRPEVVEAMARCYGTIHANPASAHGPGRQARRALEDAREQMATILDVDLAAPRRDRLIFTSGGTEANNLAILGIASAVNVTADAPPISFEDLLKSSQSDLARKQAGPGVGPGWIIISSAEHQSILEPAEHLLERGWRLDTLGLTSDGVVRVEQLAALLKPWLTVEPEKERGGKKRVLNDAPATEGDRAASGTFTGPPRPGWRPALVSVQLANHETGVVQPVGELAALCRQAEVLLHSDAIGVVGKLPVSFRELDLAAMSVTAHKFQGPLGIGALIVRHDVPLAARMFGGHQQGGVRPGTESAALAVGMAMALELWQRDREGHASRLRALRDRFEGGLRAALPEIVVHGAAAVSGPAGADRRLPQTSNIAFPGLDGQILLMALDLAGVACSVGSACSSGSTELSPTLRAMDLPTALVSSSLRFSVGATTTQAEVDEAVGRIVFVCRQLWGESRGETGVEPSMKIV
jgi:cysteine desulfurase